MLKIHSVLHTPQSNEKAHVGHASVRMKHQACRVGVKVSPRTRIVLATHQDVISENIQRKNWDMSAHEDD